MKKPKVIYHNKADNNISEQKSSSCSHFTLVLHRLFFKKKDILGLYSYKLRVFLKALLNRRCSNRNNYIKNARNIRAAGITSSFLLVLLGISIIAPLHANSPSTPASATSSYTKLVTTLTLATESNIAGVDLLVKDAGGTFASSDNSGSTLGFNVSTTNLTGYTLSIISPSDTTYNNGKLTNTDTTNCTDPTKCVLNTISSASNTISTNGTWGYKPSKLNSTENNNYLPSPTTTPTILDETDSPNTTPNPYTISIGAKADYTQPAGVYSNTYTLQATGNIVVIYMQDVTKEDMQALLPDVGDTMILYDKRDNSDYQVTNINGEYWMTQNLRITGTISATDSNFTGDDFNVSAGDLTSGNSYTEARSHLGVDSNSSPTAWYNFCAASAGSNTGCSDSAAYTANADICPSGWRLPTRAEQTAADTPLYNPVYSGYYYNGTNPYIKTYSRWWSSTTDGNNKQSFMEYQYDILMFGSGFKSGGNSIRCIKREPYSLTINFAGSGVSSVQIRTTSGTDGELIGTVSSSGGTISNLEKGFTYYLYPVFSNDYELSSWSNTGTYGTLSSTSSTNPTFTIGAGDGVVTITGKSSTTTFAQAYAAAGKTQTSGYYKMQDMASAICSKVTNGQSATLRDTRNNTNYTVAKISGRCWMTSNLALGSSSTMALTSATSNVSSSGYTLPESSAIGFVSVNASNVYNSGSTACSSTSSCYGYYTWLAATAGSGGSSGDASYDICPRGWRLPTSSEYTTLSNSYSSLTSSPFRAAQSGYYYNSAFKGGSAQYWSSTAASSSKKAYRLSVGSDGSSSVSDSEKLYGYSIRCVAK